MADPNDPLQTASTHGDAPIHVDSVDARAGATSGAMRYVLAISLILVIAIFAFLVIR